MSSGSQRPGRVFFGLAVFGAGLLWAIDRLGGVQGLLDWLARWWPGLLLLALLAAASSFVTTSSRSKHREIALPVIGIVTTAMVLLVALTLTTSDLDNEVWAAGPVVLCLAGYFVAVSGGRDESALTVLREAAWFRRLNLISTAPALRSVSLRVVVGIADVDLTAAKPRQDFEAQFTGCLALIRVRTPATWRIEKVAEAGPNVQIVDVQPAPQDSPVSVRMALLGAGATVRVIRSA